MKTVCKKNVVLRVDESEVNNYIKGGYIDPTAKTNTKDDKKIENLKNEIEALKIEGNKSKEEVECLKAENTNLKNEIEALKNKKSETDSEQDKKTKK